MQLEPRKRQIVQARQIAFQFHKGAIRTRVQEYIHLFEDCFNSIKVQLEPIRCHLAPIDKKMFQFHKGAIRTLGEQPVYVSEVLFQFHKGAIRTNSGYSFMWYIQVSIP